MPKIRTYTNQAGVSGATNAYAGAAYGTGQDIRRGLESIAQGVGEIGKGFDVAHQHDVQQEVARISAGLATLAGDQEVAWQKTLQSADPTDTTVAEKFMTGFDEQVSKLGESVETDAGRQHFEEAAAHLRAGMFKSTAAGQAELAGKASVSAVLTTVSQLSSAASRNPGGFEDYIALNRSLIAGQTAAHGLPSDEALTLDRTSSTQIAKAAFEGMAENNPEQAIAALHSGRFDKYTNGDNASWEKFAEGQIRARAAQAHADTAEQHRQETVAFKQTMSQIALSAVGDDGQVHMPANYFQNLQKAGQMPGADPGQIRAAIKFGQSVAHGDPAASDPHTYLDLMDRISRGDLTTESDLYMARGNNTLTNKDFVFLRGWMKSVSSDPNRAQQAKQLSQFFNSVKPYILKPGGIGDVPDAAQTQRFYEYQMDMTHRFQADIASGKSPEQVFQSYREEIPRYQVRQGTTLPSDSATPLPRVPQPGSPERDREAAIAAGFTRAMTGQAPAKPVPAYQPGESMADYAKRLGGH